jgi:hypothetical protein
MKLHETVYQDIDDQTVAKKIDRGRNKANEIRNLYVDNIRKKLEGRLAVVKSNKQVF